MAQFLLLRRSQHRVRGTVSTDTPPNRSVLDGSHAGVGERS
jgi:hypothetical protein